MVAVLHCRLSVRKMLLHWFLCFFGNLAGSLFVMAIIIGCKITLFLNLRVNISKLTTMI